MRTIDQIRHERFMELMSEVKGSVKDMAARIGVSSAQISQIKNRSIHSISGKPRVIGDDLARKLETAFKKPEGWMDTLSAAQSDRSAGERGNADGGGDNGGLHGIQGAIPLPSGRHRIPVVGSARLGDNGFFAELEYPVGHGDGYIYMPTDDPNAYALLCKGDSMEPRINEGEFVIVSPSRAVVGGDEVVVQAKDGRVMVKKFLYEREGRIHLISVNKAHPEIAIDASEVDKMHRVVGHVDRTFWRAE